jgi:hypothetical protein
MAMLVGSGSDADVECEWIARAVDHARAASIDRVRWMPKRSEEIHGRSRSARPEMI